MGLVALSFVAAVGCGGTDDERATSSRGAASAFTVESGDRFVVSASPDKIVLKKNVDGASFPFDEFSLKDKAILIHPIEKKGDSGVYSRAISVQDNAKDGTYVIDAEPLTLEEMATAKEDDIVRIFIDGKALAKAKKRQEESVLRPSTFHSTLHPLSSPLSVSGLAFTGFDLGTGLDLSMPLRVNGGIAFSHTIEKVSLEPEVLADYSRDTGLDLGFRAAFGWKSKLTLSGRVAGEILRTPTLQGPPLLVFVPIGFVPVPVTLQGSAFVSCSAVTSGIAEAAFEVEVSAKIGGSLRVQPTTEKSPRDWISEGPWPNEATGSAGVTPTNGGTWSAAVSCSLPRIEVHANVAGVAGPYLAVAPIATVKSSGATLETKLSAGVGAGLLGLGTGVEVVLYSWKP